MIKLTKPQQLWVNALRSGRYPQEAGRLQNLGYCCLGVACEVARQHNVEVKLDKEGRIWGITLADQPAVMQWLSIRDPKGLTDSGTLISLNDQYNKPFDEIADFIEAKADELFSVHANADYNYD